MEWRLLRSSRKIADEHDTQLEILRARLEVIEEVAVARRGCK